jgi:hypothetical protein
MEVEVITVERAWMSGGRAGQGQGAVKGVKDVGGWVHHHLDVKQVNFQKKILCSN